MRPVLLEPQGELTPELLSSVLELVTVFIEPGRVAPWTEMERLLVYDWAWRGTPDRVSLVTVTFKPDGDGTLFTLTHEQFFDEQARDRHNQGWEAVLAKLEAFLA